MESPIELIGWAAAAIGAASTIAVLWRGRRAATVAATGEAELAALRAQVQDRDSRLARLEADRSAGEALLDALPVPICLFGEDGRPRRDNARFREVLGADRATTLLRLLVARRLEELLSDDGIVLEERLRVPDRDGQTGECMVTLWRVGPKVTEGGGIAAMVAAPMLGDSAIAPFLREAPIGVGLIDGAGQVIDGNETFARPAGTELATLRRQGLKPFMGEAAWSVFTAYLETSVGSESVVPAGGATEIELGAEGGTFVSLYVRRVEGRAAPDAQRNRFALYLIDVSSRKALERQFVQSQKMQAVGQLAGGVAHDFNNLLTAMTGYCDLLLLRHRPGDQSFADIMQIRQNVNRAANLVRQLLAFSRQQTMIPRVLDVTEALADLSHLLRRLIGETIVMEIMHGRDLKPVKVDQGQIEQVVINLVVNARDAMPDGGKVTMRTYNVTVTAPVREGEEVMPSGVYVMIEVADTGTGIPPENLGRIFEPFFSTKEVGAGTGLGLATVYGIVKQTGGYIFVDSKVGEGTTFSIYLPAYDGTEQAVNALSEERVVADGDLTGSGTILLVEDEDPVRLFGARALRNKGYKVLESRSAEAALALLADADETIDLLITDVVMPGMDGPSLVRIVRETMPDLPVICISGYSEDALRQRISQAADIHFLPKPFSLKQLAGKVKDVLDARPA